MSKCKAIMQFGDDHGDNTCTFHCELEEGHEGRHREAGVMYEEFPYILKWDKDNRFDGRTLCPKCQGYELTYDWQKTPPERTDGCWWTCDECGHSFEETYEDDQEG